MKKIFPLILLAALSLQVAAQDAPDWHIDWTYNQQRPDWKTPNASDYENFTVMVVQIQEALQPYASSSDMLALFVGDELRGLAKPASVMSDDTSSGASASAAPSSFVLKAFGNETDGTNLNVTLKYYNAQLQHLFTRSGNIVFSANNVLGIVEDFIPSFTLGSAKYPVVTTIDVPQRLAAAGIALADGDLVSAFVGDECRGVMTKADGQWSSADGILTVFLRQDGETVTLKCYDAANQRVLAFGEGGDVDDVLLGDATGDGIVDVSDYIGIANYILGNIPEGFNVKAADVNGDSIIDVSDYIGVANIILYGNINGK